MAILNDNSVQENLNSLNSWELINKNISKEFELKDFKDAVAFVLKVAIEAEKADHHPDINIYSWNKVKVSLTTHSAGGLTSKDFALAREIDNLS